ncbi:unnamed protein product [Euphydryas editha]|uniref:Uncharacterized protein n=1 Tax=Euphydryas editha TaxID=104508 RepID=A0AAU9V8P1_EUPED|nr:unnamed protein product [Euphydryas editha]
MTVKRLALLLRRRNTNGIGTSDQKPVPKTNFKINLEDMSKQRCDQFRSKHRSHIFDKLSLAPNIIRRVDMIDLRVGKAVSFSFTHSVPSIDNVYHTKWRNGGDRSLQATDGRRWGI